MKYINQIIGLSCLSVTISAIAAPDPAQYSPTLELSDKGDLGINLNNYFWQDLKRIYDMMPQYDPIITFDDDYDSRLTDYPYTDYYPVNATNFIDDSHEILTHLREGSIPVALVNQTYGLNLEINSLGPGESFVIAHQFENFAPSSHYYAFYNPFWENPHALQYWFYYTNNHWLNNHVGDWEGISLFFDKDEKPIEANYSTHYEARKYDWRSLTVSGSSPTVYVSHGGHGSYGVSGETSLGYPVFNATDDHEGNAGGGIGRFEKIKTINLKGTDVLDFDERWGADDDSPLGPRFREDKKQFFRDEDLAKDPYNNCQNTETIRIFGNDLTMPDYENMKAMDTTTTDTIIEAIINFGPWRWSSGYFEYGPPSCEPINEPSTVYDLQLTQTNDQVDLTWQTANSSNTSFSSKPFGFTLSVYKQNDINNKKHEITSYLDSCTEVGAYFDKCSASINLADYEELSGSSIATLCIAVTAWNPAGDIGETAKCLKPNFAIVVDDTGSMSEEINTIKSQLTSAVSSAPNNSKKIPIFHLVTFKDGATHRLISADTDEVINAIDRLSAFGGGSCPESAGSGLEMAANEIVENGKLIWATDATANDPTVVARAKETLANKSVEITTLLSGDCNETLKESARLLLKSDSASNIIFSEKIDRGDTGENAPLSQKEALPISKSVKAETKSKETEFLTFDGLDWEADSGLNDAASVLTGYKEGFVDRYIGFTTKWGDDVSDMFSIYLNPGIYEIRVEVPSSYNARQNIRSQLYNKDGDTVGSGGYSTYGSTYTAIIDSSSGASWFGLNVTYDGSIDDTPVKYRVFVEESPYAFMSTRDLFEKVTEELGGDYYYVPEIKDGDKSAYEDALDNIFNAAFRANPNIEGIPSSSLMGILLLCLMTVTTIVFMKRKTS